MDTVIIGVIAVGVLAVLIGYWVVRAGKEDAVRSTGRQADATIVEASQRSGSDGGKVMVRFRVLVERDGGKFPATLTESLSLVQLAQYTPGTRIRVSYSTANPDKVVFARRPY